MADDAELQAKIAAIAGKINEHKQQQEQPPFTPRAQNHPHRQYTTHPRYSRWSPYARGGRPAPVKNRTLVLAGGHGSPPQPSTKVSNNATPNAPQDAFVTSRAPGRQQLMNKNTFQREQKQLLQYQEDARAAKRQKINNKERTALMQHVTASPASDHREVVVEGIRYQLRDDGSKLIRIPDTISASRLTPKRVSIANVDFRRTKTGNLVRSNAIRPLLKSKTPNPCESFTKHGTQTSSFPRRRRTAKTPQNAGKTTRSALTCVNTGYCPYGANCKFAHDPNKIAMCKTFLKQGSCPAGDACDLSHDPTYHRVPACTHFLRGNCTNSTCPYPHVHVSENAPVCRAFSTLSYCPLGEECPKRHLFVCADYVNRGKCGNARCSLPHPDHASVLRKAAAKQAKTGSEDESDVSSDDEDQDDAGFEDIDSDAAEELMTGEGGDTDHALSQQQDFIALS